MVRTSPARWLLSGVLCGFFVLASGACGDGDGDSKGCESSDDCTTWECVCKNGSSPSVAMCINNVCGDQSVCDGMCDKSGGLVSVHEKPSVKDSPECDAFCKKVASLGCGGSDHCSRSFHCGIKPGECAESARAVLACRVETGTWECMSGGGWSESDSCLAPPCNDAGAEGGD